MEQDTNTPQKQSSTTRNILIGTAFVVIIIVLSWLAIQAVNVMPSAFSSLASLAEGVRGNSATTSEETNNTDALVIEQNTNEVTAGGTLDLSWSPVGNTGSYVFSYECVEGVAINLIRADGEQRITCNNSYSLGQTDAVTLMIESEKTRTTEVAYTVGYLGTNDRTPRTQGSGALTVTNPTIAANDDVDDSVTDSESDTTPEPDESADETDDTPTTPTTPAAPTYEYTYEYAIPESDPNGFADLGVTIVGFGSIVGNTFFPGQIASDDTGAVQFEVRNYGTKTSEEWTYTIELPNGDYTSGKQAELKPNERALISIEFSTEDESSHQFEIDIDTDEDTNRNNDRDIETALFY